MDDFRFAWPFLIPLVSIVGAFTYAIVHSLARARVRELEGISESVTFPLPRTLTRTNPA